MPDPRPSLLHRRRPFRTAPRQRALTRRSSRASARRRSGLSVVPAMSERAEGKGGMIDLYTWTTPNGRKASIMLEELGLPYRVHPIDISKGDQFKPDFVAVNPNSKIPAIIDSD